MSVYIYLYVINNNNSKLINAMHVQLIETIKVVIINDCFQRNEFLYIWIFAYYLFVHDLT